MITILKRSRDTQLIDTGETEPAPLNIVFQPPKSMIIKLREVSDGHCAPLPRCALPTRERCIVGACKSEFVSYMSSIVAKRRDRLQGATRLRQCTALRTHILMYPSVPHLESSNSCAWHHNSYMKHNPFSTSPSYRPPTQWWTLTFLVDACFKAMFPAFAIEDTSSANRINLRQTHAAHCFQHLETASLLGCALHSSARCMAHYS